MLTVAIVVANMTTAFSWSWDDKENGNNKNYNGPYSHVSIAVGTENNGEWQLAEKPIIYTEVEETYCTKCEEGKKHKVCNSEGKRIVNKEIILGNKQNSNNNGTEYQSDMNYSFTTDTVFTVTAKFTNGTKTTDTQTFTISNAENYKDSGLTFYQYCCKNYCDNHTGIDMKLSYEELVAHFYDVQYVVDGNVSTDITDGNDYEAGDEVTVTDKVPVKDGYRFDGWTLNDDTETLYQANDKAKMIEGGLKFKAQWTKLYNVYYYVDTTLVETKTFPEGTDVTNEVAYVYNLKDDSKTITDFVLETENANLASINSDLVYKATTSTKTFTVVFLDNDGTILSSEKYDYGTQITVPANPKKADSITDGDEATQTPAKWYKFYFNSWTASGDYTTDSSVTQDMTFTAEYNCREVVVKYYVLDAGLAQPSELAHYPVANYSKGVVGSVYHFTEIANNDDALAANLANVPEITAFTLEDVDGNVYTPNEDQSIKWYVLKKEADNWHVDGIITNQMYTVTVNYLEEDTDKVLAESTTQSVVAGTEYTVNADIVEGYVLSSDKAEVTGIMPYDNVTVNFFYVVKEVETTTEVTTEDEANEEIIIDDEDKDAIKEDENDALVVNIEDEEILLDGGNPKTGDSSSNAAYIATLFAAALAGIASVFGRKKVK